MTELHDWQEHVYRASQHDDFFESDEWFFLRLQTFKRDNYTCLRCDKKFSTTKLNAHHLTPRDQGGGDAINNLITLCEPCHDFVEVNNLANKAQISGSMEVSVLESEEPKYKPPMRETFERPEWHQYVYGGRKRRR